MSVPVTQGTTSSTSPYFQETSQLSTDVSSLRILHKILFQRAEVLLSLLKEERDYSYEIKLNVEVLYQLIFSTKKLEEIIELKSPTDSQKKDQESNMEQLTLSAISLKDACANFLSQKDNFIFSDFNCARFNQGNNTDLIESPIQFCHQSLNDANLNLTRCLQIFIEQYKDGSSDKSSNIPRNYHS
jgi:hypothetical protein